jgi:tRNA (mo5U34)-methyltransferase
MKQNDDAELPSASQDEVIAAKNLRWFHSHEFPDGEVAEGVKSLEILQAEADNIYCFPVSGKTVLDIGAWDGFFSFEAERRGASLVHSTDHFCWSGPGWGTKDGYDYAHRKFGSTALSTDVDLFDLDPGQFGTFNVVLFLGVLYHLKDPFKGMEKAATMSNDLLIVETVTALNHITEPVMRYYLGDELNGDATNYWAPNHYCLLNMLKELGFRRFKLTPEPDWPAKQTSRTIVHAWRS